ncbi:MAG TPA: hypothetical protein VK506_16560, partial [Conexibacter sp.]|nr:hypothetical protein [Conexibacter sp.]
MTSKGQLARGVLFAAIVVALGASIVHALTGFGGPSVDAFIANDLYLALELTGVALFATRALVVSDHRAAWWCITAAFACWTAGDVVWVVAPEGADRLLTDLLYLAFYPLACAGLALLAAQGREHVAARMWIDGLLAALTVAAVVVAVAFNPIVDATHGDVTQTAINLAYPIGDLVLVG